MTALVLAALFTAFFLAVLEQVVDLKMFRALAALILAGSATLLLGGFGAGRAIVTAFSAAFLGTLLVAISERIVVMPAIITREIGRRQ